MFSKLLDTASLLKAKIAKDNLDLALLQATNDDNWQASTNILHQISSSAYNHEKWERIKEFIWDKLKNNKRWKKIVKALTIVEFLLKNGPQFASRELRREMHFFRTMQSFQAYQDSLDRGASIRQKSKIIVNLLDNDDLLQQERQKAKQIREKMSKFSGNSSYNSQNGRNQQNNNGTPKYESYNNKQIQSNFQGSFGERYNNGNYNYKNEEQPRINTASSPTKKQPQKEATNYSTTTYQTPKPIVYQPIVNVRSNNRTEQKRQNFQSLSSKLRNAQKSGQSGIQVPDQSYKKKNAEDFLIDTQAHFMEERYHIHHEEPKDIPKIQKQPQPSYYISPKIQKVSVPIQQTASLLTSFQGLNFLGIPSTPASTTSVTPVIVQNQQQQPNEIKPPLQNFPIIPQTPVSPIKQNPIPYTQPIAYNQSYQSNPYQQNNNVGYYNPPYPPQINQYQYPINYYPQPQQYNPYIQYQNTYPQNQSSYNQPYSPYSFNYADQIPPIYSSKINSISSSQTNRQSQQASGKANEQSQKDQFGEFKNGGSFQIEKINWMTSKEKNLTDLTDLAISPADVKKQQKKQFGNNIKIDLWAW